MLLEFFALRPEGFGSRRTLANFSCHAYEVTSLVRTSTVAAAAGEGPVVEALRGSG